MSDRLLKSGLIVVILAISAAMFYVIKHDTQGTFISDPEVITLHEYNTLSLRSPVTPESMAELVAEAREKADNLDPTTPLYLVLNTPGGDVESGLDAFMSLRALQHEIKTITVFSASMGFYAVQYLGERLITSNGKLMAHHISLQAVGGTSLGIIQTRLNMIRSSELFMEQTAANRAHVSLDFFNNLIANEYWAIGQQAVVDRFADRVVLVKCGPDLSGSETVNQVVGMVLGVIPMSADVEVPNCPI